MSHVFSTTYLDVQPARASAILPAAGAYDSAPLELRCPGFTECELFCDYTRGGAAGAFTFKAEVSPVNTGDAWHKLSIFERDDYEFIPEAGGAEKFRFRLPLDGVTERIRVSAKESGNLAAPGTLAITASFGVENG